MTGNRNYFVFLMSLLLTSCLVVPRPVCAQEDQALRLLTAVGNSELNAAPDVAEIRIGVETEAETATEARRQNAERAERVIQAIRAIGIPQGDIRTSNFSVSPVRRYPTNEVQRDEPPIVGYNVANIVIVRTGNFDIVSRIIDESIAAGANRVDSVTFTLRNDQDARTRALKEASEEARRNAEAMASALGVRIVRLQNVQQGGAGVTPQPIFLRSALAAESAPTPIFPREVSITASVTVSYVIQ